MRKNINFFIINVNYPTEVWLRQTSNDCQKGTVETENLAVVINPCGLAREKLSEDEKKKKDTSEKIASRGSPQCCFIDCAFPQNMKPTIELVRLFFLHFFFYLSKGRSLACMPVYPRKSLGQVVGVGWFLFTTWVLWIKPKPSGLVAGASTHWTTLPAHGCTSCL